MSLASAEEILANIESLKKRIFCAPEHVEAVRHAVYEVQQAGGWYTAIAHPWLAGSGSVLIGPSEAEQEAAFERCTEQLIYEYSPVSPRWDALQNFADEMARLFQGRYGWSGVG